MYLCVCVYLTAVLPLVNKTTLLLLYQHKSPLICTWLPPALFSFSVLSLHSPVLLFLLSLRDGPTVSVCGRCWLCLLCHLRNEEKGDSSVNHFTAIGVAVYTKQCTNIYYRQEKDKSESSDKIQLNDVCWNNNRSHCFLKPAVVKQSVYLFLFLHLQLYKKYTEYWT